MSGKQTGQKQVVLAVDDEPTNMKIISYTLKNSCELVTVNSGKKALEIAPSIAPDLILLDIMMPDINGYEVCRQIKANPQLDLTKIILISGKTKLEERLKGYASGADDYVTKPFVPEELESKVRVFLRLVQSEKIARTALNTVDLISGQLVQSQDELTHIAPLSKLGEMTSSIIHEVNNPLSFIMMLIEQINIATKKDLKDPNFLKDRCAQIQNTILKISKIIRGISSLARNGKGDPFEKVSIARVLEDTLQVCHLLIAQKSIKLTYKPLDYDIMLECRPAQIYQVILNLVTNSIHAVSSLKDRWINVNIFDKDTGIEIVVTDSGNGIPVEIRDKLMQPFFTTKAVGKGTGLGLSIVKKIVESHDGTITLNTEHPNTQFRVYLPKTHS